jgi:hypothetical protein
MTDVVYRREGGWFPSVVADGSGLCLEFAAGADANHDPRIFIVPIEEAHLAVIRNDLVRHLLLWSVLVPLATAAGTRGPIDKDAAVERVGRVLFSSPEELDELFRHIPWDTGQLIAHGADIDLLERGDIHAALSGATVTADWSMVQEHAARSRRVKAGVILSPLSTAVLRYTGQYLHGGTVPKRLPDVVDPVLLPGVLQVIATAEEASAGMRVDRDPRQGKTATDKQDWDRMSTAVQVALTDAHPDLASEAVASVSFLMCAEAASHARSLPIDGQDDRKRRGPLVRERTLLMTDDKGREKTWIPGSPSTASAAFWEFVAESSSGASTVLILEDEARGEGVQFEFGTDAVVRITTISETTGDADSEYFIEYGLDEYRAFVRDFIDGGCAALDHYGPWMTDADEFDEVRRQRRKRSRLDRVQSQAGPQSVSP